MKKNIVLIFVLLFLRIFPYVFQNDIITNSSDNLDSNVPSFMVLKYSNASFLISNDVNLYLIGGENGFKRNFLTSGFNINALLFNFLSPIIAYKLIYILSIFLGFFGILLLIPLLSKRFSFLFQGLIAISFTFMPWFHMYNCGYISGVPILIYAIINLFNNEELKFSYLIVFLFPFFISFVLTGIFILFYYGIVLLALFVFRKFEILKVMSIGFLILLISSLISEINLLNVMLFAKDFVSHRLFRGDGNFVFSDFLIDSIKILKHGRTHAFSNHTYIGYFVILSSIIYLLTKIYFKEKIKYIPFLLLVFLFFNTILGETSNFFLKILFLKAFDFSRFTILNPTLVYIIFILFLDLMLEFKKQIFHLFAYLFIVLNLLFTAYFNPDFKLNAKSCYQKIEYKKFNAGCVYFNSYYDEPLFNQCKHEMNAIERKPVVVALGLYPGILNYNNIATLDHYTNNYDLKYKLKFRKIIEKEISKSDFIKQQFDGYGSRCFMFSSELIDLWHPNRGELITKFSPLIHVKDLGIDTNQLSSMKCNFIISTVKIENFKNLKLELVKELSSSNSIYRLFLYHIKKDNVIYNKK